VEKVEEREDTGRATVSRHLSSIKKDVEKTFHERVDMP